MFGIVVTHRHADGVGAHNKTIHSAPVHLILRLIKLMHHISCATAGSTIFTGICGRWYKSVDHEGAIVESAGNSMPGVAASYWQRRRFQGWITLRQTSQCSAILIYLDSMLRIGIAKTVNSFPTAV